MVSKGEKENLDKKILIVDDHEENRILLSYFLKSTHYKFDFAFDGSTAFENIQSKNYDLIIMDLKMPNLDGVSATKKIREWEKNNHKSPVPIIALTAIENDEADGESLAAGCNEHLTKPIKKEAFLKVIDRYLIK